MKKFYYTLTLMLFIASVNAQQAPQFSQRMFDAMAFNPAVAGSKNFQEIKLHSRVQWVGFKDAPRTHLLSYNGRVFKSSGIGAYVVADQTGPTRRNGISLGYAHHIKFSNFNISFGLSSLLSQFSFDTNQLKFHDIDDPIIATSKLKSKLTPDFTFGAMAYAKKFYFGLSATEFIATNMKGLGAEIPATQQYYLMGGYNLSWNPEWSLTPSVTATFAKNYPAQAEINFKAEYQGKYLGGVSFRTEDAVVALVGMRATKQIFVAYSFDLLYSKLRNYNSGSHEIVIFIELKGKKRPPMFFLEDNDNEQFTPHWY